MPALSGEQLIALVTLLITSASGAVGFIAKRLGDAKVVQQTADLKAEADKSAALSAAWERLVNSAEKREAAANERTDRTVDSVAQLTATVGELSATLKLLGTSTTELTKNQQYIIEELRKCTTSMDGFARDLARR